MKAKAKRKGRPLHVWTSAELRRALEASARKNRRTLRAEVCLALERHLAARPGMAPKEEVCIL